MSRTATCLVMLLGMVGPMSGDAQAQTSGLGLHPARTEVEIPAGEERTVGFRIETPPSDVPVRGRLLLSLTDWAIDENANVRYTDPGTEPFSASPWILFSPAAVSVSSGQSQLVRVTIRVPAEAEPGVYRSAIFIQERPPATPPGSGEHLLFFRFRYAYTLYVIVPPVAGRGELLDLQMTTGPVGVELIFDLRNIGSRHLRPRVNWTLQDQEKKEILSVRNAEAPVLMPFSSMRMRLPVASGLSTGSYEITAHVDFNDGAPVHAVRRKVEIPDGAVAELHPTKKSAEP